MNIETRNKLMTSCIIILLGVFACSMISCKSPENPNTEISANIFVSNECGISIDVYMDGVYQFSIEFLYYDVIYNVPAGVYEIVVKKMDTDEELSTNTVDVYESGEFWITILSDASLKIINEYGEALNIYTNGSLQGELGNGEEQVLTNVPFGDHLLEASKTSDNTLVESVTLSVVEEKEYTWTIK
jgi:hypothetical protein